MKAMFVFCGHLEYAGTNYSNEDEKTQWQEHLKDLDSNIKSTKYSSGTMNMNIIQSTLYNLV